MRRAGRVSPLFLGVVLAAVALAILLFYGQEGPAAAGSRFMDALARGDVNALTEASYVPGKTPDELRKDWEFATSAGKHYMFYWSITSSSQVNPTDATVRLAVQRNFSPGSFDENYGLPLHKIDASGKIDPSGKWKVDASGISREVYPALPRPGKD